jgi:hypothetical protein
MTLHTSAGVREKQSGYRASRRHRLRAAAYRADQAALDRQIKDLGGRAVDKIVDLGGLVVTPGAQ